MPVWMEQGPREPIEPHTPIWDYTFSGIIPARDVLALILSVRANPTIISEPRYLSWLSGRYVAYFRQPPVLYWPRFRELAEMPIKDWADEGQRLWQKLCQYKQKEMPWYLDDIFREAVLDNVIPYPQTRYANTRSWEDYYYAYVEGGDGEPSYGLKERPGRTLFNAYAVWHVALGHIKRAIGKESYYEWVHNCEAVYYDKNEKKLFVLARSEEAVEALNTRYRSAVEYALEGVAQGKVNAHFLTASQWRELKRRKLKELEEEKKEEGPPEEKPWEIGRKANEEAETNTNSTATDPDSN